MPDVQMDFDLMDEASHKYKEAAQHMDALIRAMQDIAGRLEDGALLGKAGDALADAVRSRLISRVARLQDKFDEISMDIYGALVDLRDGDTEAASRFK